MRIRNSFQLIFTVSYSQLIQFSVQKAHDSIRKALATLVKVSPLRIADLYVRFQLYQIWLRYTVRWNPRAPRAFRTHHPISSASFNLKGCNLVCATGWPKYALTKNFSPVGPVVPEIWPNMWEKSQKKRVGMKESSEWPKFQWKLIIIQKLQVRSGWNFLWQQNLATGCCKPKFSL